MQTDTGEEVSTREIKKITVKGRQTWVFAQTPPLSTYNFSVIAGPFTSFSSRAGDIPLRLFCRQSLAKYVRPADCFPVTKAGLEFYRKYFKYPYPFKK